VRLYGAVTLPGTTAVLARQREAGLHPGACVVASLDAERAGVAGVGGVGPGTVIPWFSMTKVTLALRVAMAWEAGALALDDPVARFLPDFAAGGKAAVTVRHLLTHTGGFRSADATRPLDDWDAETARICAARLERGWVPGRTAGYSARAGAHVLAEVVRRSCADARPWDRIVAEDVLAPLGMERSTLAGPPPETTAMHDTSKGENRVLTDRRGPVAPGASGRGPVEEVARLMECLYLGGAPLLAPVTVEAMTARHRTGLFDKTFGAKLDWGLGLIVDAKVHGQAVVPYGFGASAGPRTYGHGGSQSSGMLCDPDAGLVAVLACTGMPGDAAHSRRAHEVWTALYDDLGLVDRGEPGRA
jgi:CubicO group peptidase (beta-lactamase class C family)